MPAIRETILDVAGDLFYREGIRAVGIDRIIAVSGAAKATLYRHFPSKEQLVLAYLQKRHEIIVASLSEALDSSGLPPRERILQIFEILKAKAETDPFRGCAFLIAVSEFQGVDAIGDIARTHKATLGQIFRDLARELTPRFEDLGEEIALCYEGALASVTVSRTSAPVDIAMRCVRRLIDAAPARPRADR